MTRVFIGIGSNIEPAANIRRAIEAMSHVVRVKALSTFYRTAPLGREGQPHFYNGVTEVEADLAPRVLKQSLLEIEAELGRRRSADKYAPRTIDLDILLYGDEVIDEPGLLIPDPGIPRRAFIAIPLYELAGDLPLPGSRMPLVEAVAGLSPAGMEALPEYTRQLRELLVGRGQSTEGHTA